jgi:hypothetical protein
LLPVSLLVGLHIIEGL